MTVDMLKLMHDNGTVINRSVTLEIASTLGLEGVNCTATLFTALSGKLAHETCTLPEISYIYTSLFNGELLSVEL
jgi:hypothetical protein